MPDAVICEPVRTAVGSYGGVFRDTSVTHLAASVIRGLVERTGITGGHIDDIVFGQGYANARQPRSAASRPWTPDSTFQSPDCNWTVAVARDSRRSSTPVWRSTPALRILYSPVAPRA